MTEHHIIEEHKTLNGTCNVLEMDIETIQDKGATYYIKSDIKYKQLQVSGKEWYRYKIFLLGLHLSRNRDIVTLGSGNVEIIKV